MTGFGHAPADAADWRERDRATNFPKTAAQLNQQSLEAQMHASGRPLRGPVAFAARMVEAQHQLAQAIAAEAALVERHQSARDVLLKLGSDAQVQAQYERALAEGKPTAAPLVESRAQQQSLVNGLQTMTQEAGAKVAHLSRFVMICRRDLVQAMLGDAVESYEAQCRAFLAAFADVTVAAEQCGQIVMPGGSRLMLPSVEGGPSQGGPGCRAAWETLHHDGERQRAAERIEAEVQRLLQLVQRVDQDMHEQTEHEGAEA